MAFYDLNEAVLLIHILDWINLRCFTMHAQREFYIMYCSSGNNVTLTHASVQLY